MGKPFLLLRRTSSSTNTNYIHSPCHQTTEEVQSLKNIVAVIKLKDGNIHEGLLAQVLTGDQIHAYGFGDHP